jgi:Skp family chaperone for outer membrane proteins
MAVGFLALGAGVASAQSAGVKFAYIDSRVVLDKAPGRAAAESTFQKEYDAAQVKIKKMQDTLEAMASAYQKSAAHDDGGESRTAREGDSREAAVVRERRAPARRADAAAAERAGAADDERRSARCWTALRKEDGYSFIFDIGTQASVIVAADSTLERDGQGRSRD